MRMLLAHFCPASFIVNPHGATQAGRGRTLHGRARSALR